MPKEPQNANPLHPVAFSAAVEFAAGKPDAAREFCGIAYGGGVITDHPLFPRVAFDLATTKVVTPSPALLHHDDQKRAGVIKSAAVGTDIRVSGVLLSNAYGAEVVKDADEGMPWQMSVRIHPGKIDNVPAGESIQLNGRSFSGPLRVYRNNRVREVSFCALGADDTTSANVFAIGSTDAPPPQLTEVPDMDKAEHDRIVAELTTAHTAALAAATATADAEKARADKAETDLTALRASVDGERKERRVAAVKELFAAQGKEYKDDVAKPYVDMSDEAFAAVSADMRGRKGVAPHLFREQTNEKGAVDLNDAGSILTAAKRYQADEERGGNSIAIEEAVVFVCGGKIAA